MKYMAFIFAFFVWIFVNGFWEIAKAPEHLQPCQQVEWAQEQNKSEFRPDQWLALWILKSAKCDSELHLEVSRDLDKNPMATAYICWMLANDAGRKEDSDLFAKMISMVKKSPSFKPEDNSEFMEYAARRVVGMSDEKRDFYYVYACLEPLKNIQRASDQGMLD